MEIAKKDLYFRAIKPETCAVFQIRKRRGNLFESIGSMSHKGLAINFSNRCYSFANDVVSKAAFGKKCNTKRSSFRF